MTGPAASAAQEGNVERRRIALGEVGSGWRQGAGGGGPQRDALAALISGIIAGEQRSAATAIAARSAAAAAGPPHPPHRIPPAERASYPQPPPCTFLRPGQTFEGRQRVSHSHHGSTVKQEHWEVQATIQHYDPSSGYIAGTMEAANVPDALEPVRTFFEGEIIDNVNHTFYTADWDACADTDFLHWSKFPPFRELHAEVVRHGGRCPSLAGHSHVFMRWKEQFFLTGSECRLTIAGFYYLACNRKTGEVLGWYFDPSSSPDQKLDLCARRAGPAGWAFPHYELA
ncbi:hypothetical protein ABPG77_007016 [Micractinium sp. CCAP 211/92]